MAWKKTHSQRENVSLVLLLIKTNNELSDHKANDHIYILLLWLFEKKRREKRSEQPHYILIKWNEDETTGTGTGIKKKVSFFRFN